MIMKLEYVWIDGFKPWGLRSKIKVMELHAQDVDNALKGDLTIFPMWGFDGSSTKQASEGFRLFIAACTGVQRYSAK